MFIYHSEPASFTLFKHFSNEINGAINESDCFLYHIRMCQYLRDLQKLMSQYFPNDQNIVIKLCVDSIHSEFKIDQHIIVQ